MKSGRAVSTDCSDTSTSWYTDRLRARSRIADVWSPYHLHIRSLGLGRTLDVGCGIGRHLKNLAAGSVGVDHNTHSVEFCRQLGLDAYTPDAFAVLATKLARFDSLLFSHILEHVPLATARKLVATYAKYLAPGGRVVMITPQEAGFASDPTHVNFLDHFSHADILYSSGFRVNRQYSFPFPSVAGRFFKHNEFVSLGVLH